MPEDEKTPRSKTSVHFTWKFILLVGCAVAVVMLTGYIVAAVLTISEGELKAQIDKFNGLNAELKEENQKYEKNNLELESHIQNLTQLNDNMESQTNTFKSENARFRDEVYRLNQTNADLKTEIVRLENFTTLLQQKVDHLQNKTKLLKDTVKELNSVTAHYNSSLDQFSEVRESIAAYADSTFMNLDDVLTVTMGLLTNTTKLSYFHMKFYLLRFANYVEKSFDKQLGFDQVEYKYLMSSIQPSTNMTVTELEEEYPFSEYADSSDLMNFTGIGEIITKIVDRREIVFPSDDQQRSYVERSYQESDDAVIQEM
eukprot:TRINITY_DN9437_c0_g2_i1.p1 TRINITY_DN9437_c0_g2~~TRINITY_DN9437_c0_g2_i1.p1  ORF type:complete len:337 (-),score=25.78 TRINITY_DN9437_c0_g2_i1:388-1329(-)